MRNRIKNNKEKLRIPWIPMGHQCKMRVPDWEK